MDRSYTMPQAVIGCDLSRYFIDICELPSGRTGQIANTPDTIAAWLGTLDHDVRLISEPPAAAMAT